MLGRLPIRVRLTAVFTVTIAVVLAGLGLFIYVRLTHALDDSLNRSLTSQANSVAALVTQADSGLRQAGPSRLAETSFAQILTTTGHVYDATPQVAHTPLLSPSLLARAQRARLVVDRITVSGVGSARLLAVPVYAQGQPLVIVAGESLDQRDQTLASLRTQLLLGGPAALALAALAGYLLSRAALIPVESMRRRADAISETTPHERLPVPDTQDEISRLGSTLNRMLDRLQAALDRERQFVADASHELRTPLALLKTELELATNRPRTPDETRLALHSALEECERLTQLADDLLILARSDNQQLPINPTTIDLKHALDTLTHRFHDRAHHANRHITTTTEPSTTLHADPLRIHQAVSNLLENALRHGAGTITLTTKHTQNTIEIHVTDEGPGFPPDYLPHAFQRFTRADAAHPRGGTGLGLAIVQAIAHAHHGTATATNLNPGTDVYLTLPHNHHHTPRDQPTNHPRC